jgi:hypothetical protein
MRRNRLHVLAVLGSAVRGCGNAAWVLRRGRRAWGRWYRVTDAIRLPVAIRGDQVAPADRYEAEMPLESGLDVSHVPASLGTTLHVQLGVAAMQVGGIDLDFRFPQFLVVTKGDQAQFWKLEIKAERVEPPKLEQEAPPPGNLAPINGKGRGRFVPGGQA